jgi:hypothetical protein
VHAEVTHSDAVPIWTLDGPGALSAASGVDVQYLPPDTETLIEPGTATLTAALGSGLTSQVQIALSPVVVPGHHWTTVRQMAPHFNSVAYGNGRYVATTFGNVFWSSADGKVWTMGSANASTADTFVGAAWSSNGWMALSLEGGIATSADGRAWAIHERVLPSPSSDLVAGNGRHIATQYGEVSSVSTDGVQWSSTGMRFTHLSFGNGYFLGIVNGEVPYRSTDGLHWAAVTDPGCFSDFAFAEGQFLGHCMSEGTDALSFDGTLWVTSDVSPLRGVLGAAGAKFFQFGFDNELGVRGAGGTWQSVAFNSYPAKPESIAFGAAGYVGVSGFGWSTTSSDGLHWTSQREGSYGDFGAVVDFNGTFVAASNQGWALSSADGNQWRASQMQAPGSSNRIGVKALAHGGGVLVAVGCSHSNAGGCNGNPAMWMRSTDAVAWSTSITPAPANVLLGVVHDGARFVAIDFDGKVYASDDGDHWGPISNVPGALYIRGLVHGGGRFVVYGDLGFMASSADGVDWVVSSVLRDADNNPRSLHGVAWDGKQFVGVGDTALKATSPDGRDWSAKEANGYSLSAVTACDGVMVGVNSAVVETSIDAAKWYQRMEPNADVELRAVACGHGRVIAVGARGSIAASDH